MSKSNLITGNLISAVIFAAIFVAAPSLTYAAGQKEVAGSGSNMSDPNAKSTWNGAVKADYSSAAYVCDTGGAELTGSYAAGAAPCSYTSFYTDHNNLPPGGTYLTQSFENWWVDEGVPKLRDFVGQLSGFVVAQTQMLATTYDGISFGKFAKTKQIMEYETRKRYRPNEFACIVSSNINALSKSYAISTQAAADYKIELEKRNMAANAEPDVTDPGALNDTNVRWKNYCQYFNDPTSNNGANACESPEAEGAVMNGDIDIEGLLMKDTIETGDANVKKAVQALFLNLVQHKAPNPTRKSLVEGEDAQSSILKSQHIQSVRNLASHVIASILARRAPAQQQTLSGQSSGTLLREIRDRALVATEDISDNPSYNEIMLAMTKERFFDPTYYLRVQDNLSAMQKEQAILESYVNLQLNDIYQVKEQINALLAARDSLKFAQEQQTLSPRTESKKTSGE